MQGLKRVYIYLNAFRERSFTGSTNMMADRKFLCSTTGKCWYMLCIIYCFFTSEVGRCCQSWQGREFCSGGYDYTCSVGTSLLLKMTVDSILVEEGINGEVEAIDMTSAYGNSADLILTSKEIGEEIEGQVSGKLVYISNFMDKEEVKEKILKAIGD